MGEIVGAGLLAHVPTIVLPEAERRELNGGKEITLVTGLRQLRAEVFETLDYDTVVVLDSHWATTVEFVITAQQRRSGLFTSEELPRGMCRMPYDFPGDPELAHRVAEFADRHGTWITPIDDYLPIYYATINLWKYLGEGLPDKRWMSVGVCQTGDLEDHFSAQARAADYERIAWFERGRHDRVLDTMPEFWKHRPEAKFFHYLMMIGALGERHCVAPGRRYGEYENSVGTGQAHLWFDRPTHGWAAGVEMPPPNGL